MTSLVGDGLPSAGDVLAGKYRVTRLLGRGGMGAVFAARHEMLGEEVALKLMLADAMREPDAVKRFVNEARAAAKIRGEHVVRVLDVGVLEDGRPYISMELMEGEDMGQVLERGGPLSPVATVDYMLQGMEAIAQAHALGVVHRDLKPSNFFLATGPDGSRMIKVLDFGIAKAILKAGDQSMTSTRAMMGSPLYMSPEQIRSAKTVDPQSDIWALGVIMYELLTVAPPFAVESVGELFFAIAEQTPPLVHTRRQGLPPGLSDVVARCLQRDKTTRFRNVVDLARALGPFASPVGALDVARIAAVFERTTSRGGSGAAAFVSTPDSAQAAPPGEPMAGAPAPMAASQGIPQQGIRSPTNGSWAQSGATAASAPRIPRAVVALAVASGVAAIVGVVAITAPHRHNSLAATTSAPAMIPPAA
ncbi:MAG: serine/threonine-protein kinase, partial [Polyangiaceae bacterium]